MKQADLTESEGFVSLKAAHDYAVKSLKSIEYARAVLKKALADGTLRARAKTILEEFAYGLPRSLDRRRLDLQINIENPPELTIMLPSGQLLRQAKGSKVIYNWTAGHVAWTSRLPTPSMDRVKTHGPRVKMPTRKVMYDVEVDRKELESLIIAILKKWKVRSASNLDRARSWHPEEYYRKRLGDLFPLAESGRLTDKFDYRCYGGVAKFNKFFLGPEALPDAKPGTVKRISQMLRSLDETALSTIQDQEQKRAQLTNF